MLPVNYSECGATGLAATNAITVSGIASGDELLAVIAWAPGADPTLIDASDATVGSGTITFGTVNTANKLLWVMWITPKD